MTNWQGFYFLLRREVHRYLSIAKTAVFPPVVSTALYVVVFGLALGGSLTVKGVSYSTFIFPGIVLMNLVTPPFGNAAFSLFEGRWHGHIKERLSAPVSYHSLMVSVLLASMTRGFLVAGLLFLLFLPVLPVIPAHPFLMAVLAVLATAVFSLLGMITGLWADDWDHVFIIQPFVLTPLLFLGGVFFELSTLPAPWDQVAAYNPLYYLVESFRGTMTGTGHVSPFTGIIVLATGLAVLYPFVYYLYKTGWKLRD